MEVSKESNPLPIASCLSFKEEGEEEEHKEVEEDEEDQSGVPHEKTYETLDFETIQRFNLLRDKKDIETMLRILPRTDFEDEELGRLEILLMDRYTGIIQLLHQC